jgi:hypothetical protein
MALTILFTFFMESARFLCDRAGAGLELRGEREPRSRELESVRRRGKPNARDEPAATEKMSARSRLGPLISSPLRCVAPAPVVKFSALR